MSGAQQRAELHKTIWALANELRGSVDGWDFKQYVLGTLFYRYISEDMAAYINKRMHEAGVKDFDYEKFPDDQDVNSKDEIVAEKGIFIKPSQLFANICRNARNDENLNTSLENAFKDIEASAIAKKEWFKGVLETLVSQGYTKTKIAEALGITPQRLTNISNGTFAISDKMMDTITATFNLGTIVISSDGFPGGGNPIKPSEENKTERIIDRLDAYLLLYGISDSQVTASAKLNADTLKNTRNNGLDLDNNQVKKILDVLPDLNDVWLKTGSGSMKKGSAIPIIEKNGPLARILQLLNEEENISLDEFARAVNSNATLFNNALKWPFDSRSLVLGNEKAIRGWVNAFCDVFPKYSKFWILTGKTSKYNYPTTIAHESDSMHDQNQNESE